MVKYIFRLLIIMAMVSPYTVFAEKFLINNHNEFSLNTVKLNDRDILWLARKKNISIGVYGPLSPPLFIINGSGELSGISANYVSLLKNTLNIAITIRKFPGEKEAFTALKSGDIDVIINHLQSQPLHDAEITSSVPFLYSYPVLITKRDNAMTLPSVNDKVRVATSGKYPAHGFIRQKYKNAVIVSYDSTEQALSSVENGDTEMFIGTNLESDYYLSTDYYALRQIKTWGESVLTQSFWVNAGDYKLINIINRFLEAINSKTHTQIADSFIDSVNLPLYDGPAILTSKEQTWINENKTLRVIVNPYNFPFSMTDSDNNLRGIAGDLLELIHIKTGLFFTPIYSNSNNETKKIIESGQWDLLPAATFSNERTKKALFSDAYLTTPFVIVVKRNSTEHADMTRNMSVAIPSHHAILNYIQDKYKNIKLVPTANSSEAITLLQEGDVDAAISTKLTAKYYFEHYESDNLSFYPLQHAPEAEIRFAMPHGDYMLKGIIDKIIKDIPDKHVIKLSNKWTDMPHTSMDTWNMYKNEFYQVVSLALILIISSIIWGFYLLREIKKRKTSELDLKGQLKFSSTLSSSVPYPLYVITAAGELINSNPAFKAFFSDYDIAASGENLSDSSHPLFRVFCSMRSLVTPDAAVSNVLTMTTKISNGSELRDTIHWFTAFKTQDSSSPLLICGWSDITEHCMLMDALKRESDNAINAKNAKGEFLAKMSHELRTPLSAIIGFLELIRLEHPRDENIELAFSTGKNLLGLIGEVLDLEKIESGNYVLSEEWFDINQLLSATVSMFDALSAEKGLGIILRSGISRGVLVWSDPQAIRQIMSNLVGNALKFSDHGKIFVDVNITCKGSVENVLIIVVSDNGNGIPEEEQIKLFKLFSQTTTARNTEGSGLGLFICNQITKMLNGKIYLSESNQSGSQFTIEIPVKLSEVKTEPPAKNNSSSSCVASSMLRILIVDDNPTNCLLIKKQLSSLGYSADEVSDGQQALDILKKKSYDLVITDINMPILDGIELTKQIRAFDNNIVIWGLTANVRADKKKTFLNSGMNLLLFKPLQLDHISSLLQTLPDYKKRHLLEKLIDMDILSLNASGEPETIKQMLIHSKNECRSDIDEIMKATVNMDSNIIGKHVHRIAGTAQIIGAKLIAQLCDEVEDSIFQTRDTTMISMKIDELNKALSNLLDAIDTYLRHKYPELFCH
ncbi:TPA: transporter substrate-binding domain-containing protein [Enterobacter mori]|nr:transporter substrate-binding domain-containing protein [Enterobacter mori]